MPRIALQELKDALLADPRALALDGLEDDEMLARIAEIADHRIHLKPASLVRHRMADLLSNLSHLKPEPRAVLFKHLFERLDLHPDAGKASKKEAPAQSTPAAPAPETPFTAMRSRPNGPLAAAEPVPSSDAARSCGQPAKRREDLFDRLLDWIAALTR